MVRCMSSPTNRIERTALMSDPFSRVPKTVLNDTRLSWQAKGILAYLIGAPADWKLRVKDIINRGSDGEHAVRSALKELRNVGYADLIQLRDDSGRTKEWVWKVSDSTIYRPDGDFPDVGFPDVEKGHHTKKDITKNEPYQKKTKTALSLKAPAKVSLKAQKKILLGRIEAPKPPVTKQTFNRFIRDNDLEQIKEHRSDLYEELSTNKWHAWKSNYENWFPIHDWKAYVETLNGQMESFFS